MRRLEGQVALVTGAARGIGAGIAVRLAAEGARMVVADRDGEGAEGMCAELAARGSDSMAVPCDVTNREQVEAAIEATLARFERLDILVNNAGILRDSLLFKMTDEDWDQVMAVHLRGAFLCSRAAQRPMVAQRHGRIVNLSSVSALGNRGQANYSAAKAGLQGLTRTLAIELGPFGITCNAVAPGLIVTDMTRALAAQLGMSFEVLQEELSKKVPLRRFGTVEEVAATVAFLVSDDASYVNGQVLYVAGGPESALSI